MCTLYCLSVPALSYATPAVTPTCMTPASGLTHTTYDTTGYNQWPRNRADYDYLISNYATDANQFGTGISPNINGSGNPYGSNEDYLTIFTGYIYAPTTGDYIFGVDGDDAIELFIDGVMITNFYGGHGRRGRAVNPVTVNLEAGYHEITFHHQEYWGGDNYYLYWQPPGSTSLRIAESSAMFNCPPTTTVSLTKTSLTISDPVNLTVNPKAIPGALVRFTLRASNTGNYTADNPIISDNLNDLISVKQTASWVEDSMTISAPSIMNGSVTNLTDITDTDAGSFNDSVGNRVVVVNCASIKSGENCIVTFDVMLN